MKYSAILVLASVFLTCQAFPNSASGGNDGDEKGLDLAYEGVATVYGARNVITGTLIGAEVGGPVGAGVGAAVGLGVAVATHDSTKDALKTVAKDIYESNQALPGGFGGEGW